MNTKDYVQGGVLENDLYSLRSTISHMKASGLYKSDRAFCSLLNDLDGSFKALEAEVNKRIE